MPLKKLLKKIQNAEENKWERQHEIPRPDNHDDSNWLVSYADMMTLLCAFFIMLFSMAKLDERQYEKVKESVSHQFGGDYTTPNKELAKFVTQIVQELGVEKDVSVKTDALGVSLVFQSTIFFDTLSSDVKSEGKILIGRLIEAVATRQDKENKKYRIVVEGHTDSRPIVGGVYPSNWELSGARAARVVRMFIDRGFSSDRLTAIGYADTHPQLPSRTPAGEWNEEALSKNRRVVLRILDPTVDSIPFPDSANAKPLTAETSTH